MAAQVPEIMDTIRISWESSGDKVRQVFKNGMESCQ
jgi:hypothetical protein